MKWPSTSAITLKPLTCEFNYFDYLVTVVLVKGDVPEVNVLEAGKMGKRKDLSDFDKGQIVMARRLGQSISNTADLVGCSRSAVVRTYQMWCKEGKPVNRRQGHGRPRLIDACGEQKLASFIQSYRTPTVAQIAEKVNADYDKKVSEHTVYRSLLRMGLRRRRPVREPMLTPVHN